MRTSPEMTNTRWRKSSYSNMNGGDCVEIADDLPGIVPVRDSKRPHSPTVVIPAPAWAAFIDELKVADSNRR